VTDAVEPGDMVRNTTDGLYSFVVSVDSQTQLTVTSNGTTWNAKAYSVNTLVENYTAGNNAYVPFLERVADAVSESNTLIFTSNIDVRTVVRRSTVATKILPFTQDGQVTGNFSVATIRSVDSVVT
jgi:hypothetical protein